MTYLHVLISIIRTYHCFKFFKFKRRHTYVEAMMDEKEEVRHLSNIYYYIVMQRQLAARAPMHLLQLGTV